MDHFENLNSIFVYYHIRYYFLYVNKILYGIATYKLAGYGHQVLKLETMEDLSDEKYEEIVKKLPYGVMLIHKRSLETEKERRKRLEIEGDVIAGV